MQQQQQLLAQQCALASLPTLLPAKRLVSLTRHLSLLTLRLPIRCASDIGPFIYVCPAFERGGGGGGGVGKVISQARLTLRFLSVRLSNPRRRLMIQQAQMAAAQIAGASKTSQQDRKLREVRRVGAHRRKQAPPSNLVARCSAAPAAALPCVDRCLTCSALSRSLLVLSPPVSLSVSLFLPLCRASEPPAPAPPLSSSLRCMSATSPLEW